MRDVCVTLLVSVGFGLLPWMTARAAPPPADLVVNNGLIHTQDSQRRVAQAMAIRGTTIVAVGSNAALREYVGVATRLIDLKGRVVLPGIIDAHTHPAMSAQDAGKCSLGDRPMSFALLKRTVAVCLAKQPLRTGAWMQVIMVNPVGTELSLTQLDQIFHGHPALVMSSDGHTGWADTAALTAAGINAASIDPAGGHIMRDSSGAPNGTLHDTATDVVQGAIPLPSLDAEAALTDQALTAMRATGITSVQDASADNHYMRIYQYLYESRRLKMRVRASLHLKNLAADPADILSEANAFRHRWSLDPEYLRADAVKIFADGGIEYPAHTASLLEPYLDGAGHVTADRGPPYFVQENLNRIIAAVDAADFTVHVHAIGDRAVRSVLDAFEYARRINGVRDNRDQIAHLELIDPEDFARFKQLGIIANFQLQWAVRDSYTVDATMPYIGPQRARYLYPARSLRDAGALLVGGSDWGVSTFNAFEAMEHAITRSTANGGTPLFLEERVSLQDMVDAYTINAAYALKQETFTGSLEVGKRADFAVLDRNIFVIPAGELHKTRVLATYLNGASVFERRPAVIRHPTH